MNIILLTHQRELNKNTNTGFIVADILRDNCEIVVWDRVSPSQSLLEKIEHEKVVLLYPTDNTEIISGDIECDSCIIIDSTWQEAQKIYNRSPYLKKIKKVKLVTGKKSIYTLRRNQKETGLCTAECAVEILKFNGDFQQANEIETQLIKFVSLNSK